MSWLIALVILAFFIVFHELGHFLVARACGVKVEVFSLGFGKKLLSFEYKGTLYALSAIPLGGYVQLKGQQEAFIESSATSEVRESKQPLDSKQGSVCARSAAARGSAPSPDTKFVQQTCNKIIESSATSEITESNTSQTQTHSSDSFLAKSPLQRIAILLAGSGFNLLLGFLLYVCVYLYGVASVPPIVGEVLDSMPAQEAGILPGDRILEINGAQIHTWEELSKLVRDSIGAISMRAQRGESQLDFTLMPRLVDSETANVFGEFIKHNAIGITAAHQTQIVRYTGFHAITKAWEKTIESSKLILQSLQKLISGAIGVQNISSVVGITHTMASFAQSDLVALLALSALISINLGIFNLLPIPPLDGGHILFTLYQSLTRKKPSERVASAIMIAGLALLLGIMSLGVYNDINRIIAP